MAITKEEWEEVRKELSHPFGCVKMTCDDHEVTIHIERKGNSLTYGIVVYVDSLIKGEWMWADSEIGRRFYKPQLHYAHNKKTRDSLIKIYGGKRCSKANLVEINKKFTIRSPIWSSVGALKKHFIENNKELAILHIGFSSQVTNTELRKES